MGDLQQSVQGQCLAPKCIENHPGLSLKCNPMHGTLLYIWTNTWMNERMSEWQDISNSCSRNLCGMMEFSISCFLKRQVFPPSGRAVWIPLNQHFQLLPEVKLTLILAPGLLYNTLQSPIGATVRKAFCCESHIRDTTHILLYILKWRTGPWLNIMKVICSGKSNPEKHIT